MTHAIRLSAALGLALALTSSSTSQAVKEFGPHLKGKQMVAFKMTDTKGKVHTNRSLKGKVVLLDFWATWCGPCKAASPTMQKLHEKYAKRGLVVIGANTMDNGSTTAAPAYAKEHKYTYTFTSKNDALSQKLGINGIPAFIFIGRDGKIAEVQTGFGDDLIPRFEAIVKKLLG